MSDKLRPCPFCGSEAEIKSVDLDERSAYAAQVSVGCRKCRIHAHGVDDPNPKGGYALTGTGAAKAIEAWNQRAEVAS